MGALVYFLRCTYIRMCIYICAFMCGCAHAYVHGSRCVSTYCVFTSHVCRPGGKAYGQLKDEQLKSLAEINDVRIYIKIHVT